jgi:hypothetical protein
MNSAPNAIQRLSDRGFHGDRLCDNMSAFGKIGARFHPAKKILGDSRRRGQEQILPWITV